MTQEEKQLLLKDLCARFPYGVICKSNSYRNILFNSSHIPLIESEEIKPYLRPMSSMTEEEYDDMFHQLYLAQEEFFRNCSNADTIGKIIGNDVVKYDWLLKNHFDFRGLIPRGLAIEVTEENNPYK